MTRHLPADRETVDKRFIALFDEIRRHPAPQDTRHTCEAIVRCLRTQVMSRIQSGNLTQQDWHSLDSSLTSLVRDMPSSEAVELAAFAEKLKDRQGTHIPDWQEFYAHRAELVRNFHDRCGGQ